MFIASSFSLQAQDYSAETKADMSLLQAQLNVSEVQYHRIALGVEQNLQMKQKLEKTLSLSKSVLDAHLKELHENKVKNIKGGLNEVQRDQFDRLGLEFKL